MTRSLRRPRFVLIVVCGIALTAGALTITHGTAQTTSSRGGALDPNFGKGGKVRTTFCCLDDGVDVYPYPVSVSAVAIGSNGSIVAGGLLVGPTGSEGAALAGYRKSGHVAFQSQPDFSETAAYAPGQVHAVASQPDGKFVVASSDVGFSLVRYTSGGKLDPSFGNDGTVPSAFGVGDNSGSNAIAVEKSGKIVIAGWRYRRTRTDFALARYTTNGTLDTSFGKGGRVTTRFASDSIATAVAIEPGGKIVAAGVASGQWALALYRTNGTLDTNFGTGGIVLTGFRTSSDGTYGRRVRVAIEPGGKIVIAGPARAHPWLLARYTTNGKLDPNFGAGGAVQPDFRSNGTTRAVAVEPNGKIVVVGSASGHPWLLARYTTSGELDPSFGEGGKVVTRFGHSRARPSAVAIGRSGKIVVAGDDEESFALARYLP